MLRNLDVTQLDPLQRLFNLVWESGFLPPPWLMGLISTFLKGGKPPSDPGSYRPGSPTSAVGKVMEIAALARL